MVTLTVLLSAKTMSRGFVGCIISWNVSFPSTMVSPKIVTAATQTPWPCVVVGEITTSLSSSMKSTVTKIYIRDQGTYDNLDFCAIDFSVRMSSKMCYRNLLIYLVA